MLNKGAVRLANRLLTKGIISEDYFDIYVYGFELLISSILSTSIILLIGIILGKILQTIAFLITFSLLRSFTGGYHANSYCFCSVVTLSIFGLVLLFSELVNINLFAYMVLAVVGFTLLFIFAPIENPNKKLTLIQKRKFKIISLVVFIVFVLIGIFLKSFFEQISNVIFIVLLADILLLFIKNRKERRVNYEDR